MKHVTKSRSNTYVQPENQTPDQKLAEMKELAADLYERLDYHRIELGFQMREKIGKLLLGE